MMQAKPRTVLLDSDVFIGLFVKTDAHHGRVQQLLTAFAQTHSTQITTTNLVVTETATMLSRRHYQEVACRFLRYLRTADFAIVHITPELQRAAEDLFLSIHTENVSVVDCANVAAVQAGKSDALFSFDRFYSRFPLHLIGGNN
ncbi:MAG: type II toxin-antitoxin system VapC family toxin [Anaerolineae bacterium]|nr:type II toxin-antitoxin system VapC family toxin [Anaerolineae bacterium]